MINKIYIGTITFRQKGKVYGATARLVWARSPAEARAKLKKRYAFPGSTITVTIRKVGPY